MLLETNYTTNLPWGLHPAGTECLATRLDLWTHTLEFQDGIKLEVKGQYWLKGLEDFEQLHAQREKALGLLFEQSLVALMAEKATQEVRDCEDQNFFDALDRALKAVADEEQTQIDIRENAHVGTTRDS